MFSAYDDFMDVVYTCKIHRHRALEACVFQRNVLGNIYQQLETKPIIFMKPNSMDPCRVTEQRVQIRSLKLALKTGEPTPSQPRSHFICGKVGSEAHQSCRPRRRWAGDEASPSCRSSLRHTGSAAAAAEFLQISCPDIKAGSYTDRSAGEEVIKKLERLQARQKASWVGGQLEVAIFP